jgi:hypothetical protein
MRKLAGKLRLLMRLIFSHILYVLRIKWSICFSGHEQQLKCRPSL